MKEPWRLAASDRSLAAPEIIKLYAKRFRDSKDLRFATGMSAPRIDHPSRREPPPAPHRLRRRKPGDVRPHRDICSVVVVVVDVVPPGISLVNEVCFVSVEGSACRGATCTSSQLLSEH
jgi:hypothetical protein